MSQHDFNIANQGFPATRADINNAFQAIASNSSGPTAPSTTYANQWWYDTTNDKMYLRNAADSAWIEVAVIDQTNNEWKITSGVIQAVDGDGIVLKTDDGITRFTLDDTGNATFAEGTDIITGSAGSNNVRIGAGAGDSIQSGGNSNVAVGTDALTANTTASNNTAVGYQALYTNTTGTQNVAIGSGALLNTSANYNTGVGYRVLSQNSSGVENTAMGSDALRLNTTGQENTAIGERVMEYNTTGNYNTSVGRASMIFNTTGGNNTALGWNALRSNTTASNNTAVGYQALYSTTGTSNTAIGYQAGQNITTGTYNTALGRRALHNTTTGTANYGIGDGAGRDITTGSYNVIVGGYSGNQNGLNISTSSNNIVLSDGDGNPRVYIDSSGALGVNTNDPDNYPSSTQTGSSQGLFRIDGNVAAFAISNTGNEIAFTRDALNYISCPKSSAELRIRCGTGGGVNLANGGTSWTSVSDERLKTITADIEDASNKVKTLRTVLGTYNDDVHNTPHAFLIAQDVQAVLPEAVSIRAEDDTLPHDGITDKLELSYTEVIPLLTAALKEVINKNEELEARITALEAN